MFSAFHWFLYIWRNGDPIQLRAGKPSSGSLNRDSREFTYLFHVCTSPLSSCLLSVYAVRITHPFPKDGALGSQEDGPVLSWRSSLAICALPRFGRSRQKHARCLSGAHGMCQGTEDNGSATGATDWGQGHGQAWLLGFMCQCWALSIFFILGFPWVIQFPTFPLCSGWDRSRPLEWPGKQGWNFASLLFKKKETQEPLLDLICDRTGKRQCE